MDFFQYRDGQLFVEDLSLDELVQQVGTPAYIYSRRTFERHFDALAAAFAPVKPLICYSIKSCGNVHLIKMLAERGAGMDVVSGGELYRARHAGVSPSKIVYAGVGKTDEEIRQAIDAKIGLFNIESEAEFENIAQIARHMGQVAYGALRVNPDVDPKTHAKTTTGKKETKFGVDIERARRFFERYGRDEHLRLTAIHLHIGSPVYTVDPYVDAITKALSLVDELAGQGHRITALDIGGGFGADYENEQTPAYSEYAEKIVPLLLPFVAGGGKVILEPGRTIAANAGVLVTRVQYIKIGGRKKFVIVDSGMHHLIRPTLYDSFHFVWPTNVAPHHVPERRQRSQDMPGLETCDIVGPICESGDFLAKDRPLPPVARGDLLCVFSAGAYGMVMASNYNAMPRPVEILVDRKTAAVIRRRETYDDLLALELEAQAV
jgi:diaminopimelate decarboxylase